MSICSARSAVADDGVDYLNGLRAQVGLGGFARQVALASAAQQHARYLDEQFTARSRQRAISAHTQLRHLPGFSGEDPAARAIGSGYAHRLVRENISMGYATTRQAIDGLMGAIYHRLAFLDPHLDEIGVARVGRSQVFLMGRSDLRRACNVPPPQALVEAPVACSGRRVRRAYLDQLCAELPKAARYERPYDRACPGGQRLDRRYMQALCAAPPAMAVFTGDGPYVSFCRNGSVFRAAWVEAFCQAPPPGAVYAYSGNFYTICDPKVAVHAEWLEARCRAANDVDLYTDSGQLREICGSEIAFRIEFLEAQNRVLAGTAPDVVLWPPEGADDVSPAFFDENPDPLPDRQVSGYPLSVQFNASRFETVNLLDISLFEENTGDWQAVTDVRLLDARRDPNAILDDFTFVLFPLQRLRWGQEYIAVVNAEVDGKLKRIEWGFATRSLGVPLLRLGQGDARFTIAAQGEYGLLVEPLDNQAATVAEVAATRREDTGLVIELVDPNTLRLRVDASGCDPVQLRFPDGRRAQLVIAPCAH